MELVFDIQLVSCLAHIRRKFVDATGNHTEKAGVALGMIEQLYELERTYKSEGLTPTQRKERRMMEAKPVFDRLMNWVEENHKLPQLQAYLNDGRIEIDNNLIENKIRPLALGRKNYLFSGSHERAEGYLQILLKAIKVIGEYPVNRIQDLLPSNFLQFKMD